MTKYTYDYPMPSVTVDAVIFCCGHVLLIRRRDDPFKDHWALPGGYMNIGERLIEAVVRETKEETNLSIESYRIELVGVFDDPSRDTRGRVISAAFSVIIPLRACGELKAGDDATAFDWADLSLPLPPMAFDHEQIIKQAFDQRKGLTK
jgi:8-oxo-dGTP diphosphatase